MKMVANDLSKHAGKYKVATVVSKKCILTLAYDMFANSIIL